jgi:hypothetical protein
LNSKLFPKGKRESHPNIRVCLLKRRRRKVKVDPKLGGQWKEEEKVFGLVANGRRKRRFLAWWPMERRREGSFLPLPLFPQVTLFKPSFFILHIKVLLCPGPRPLFTPSFRFPWPIYYDRIF